MATASAPSARRRSARSSSCSMRLAAITTLAPPAASTSAKRAPKPEEAPVRIATRPSIRNASSGSSTGRTLWLAAGAGLRSRGRRAGLAAVFDDLPLDLLQLDVELPVGQPAAQRSRD